MNCCNYFKIERTSVTCNICLLTMKDLKLKNVLLNVLKCGHILCDICTSTLKLIKTPSKCPFCRFKLIVEFNLCNIKCINCNKIKPSISYLNDCFHILCNECIQKDMVELTRLNYIFCIKCEIWRNFNKIFI